METSHRSRDLPEPEAPDRANDADDALPAVADAEGFVLPTPEPAVVTPNTGTGTPDPDTPLTSPATAGTPPTLPVEPPTSPPSVPPNRQYPTRVRRPPDYYHQHV